jgi:hypothetical protein
VQIFDEALYGFPEADRLGRDITEELWGKDNKVSIEGWAERPFPADCGAPTLTGGAAISVGAGRATVAEFNNVSLSHATGTVRFLDGSAGQPGGRVVVVARECDERGNVDPIGDRVTADAQVNNGRFGLEFRRPLDADFGLLQAHYLGDFGAAPSDSEPKLVRR